MEIRNFGIDAITIRNSEAQAVSVQFDFRAGTAHGSLTVTIPGGDDSLRSIRRNALLEASDKLRLLAGDRPPAAA